MSKIVVRAENIGKKYQYGEEVKYRTIREDLFSLIKKRSNKKSNNYNFWALKDVSFDIEEGEIIGIIGRNGAGKSTLLKILSRITKPTKGNVYIQGRIGSLLEVGTGFHPELTGLENIYLNGSILGMKKGEIDSKLSEIIDFAEVKDFIHTPVKRYSSGMFVRLAFAVAAHLDPEILLFDEVLAVGDIEFQKRCIKKISNITQQGRTVIIVSHNMSTIKSLCSRAVLLDRGSVKDIGSVNSVVASYLSSNKSDSAVKVIQDKDYIMRSHKIKINKIALQNPVSNYFCVYWNQPLIIKVEFEVFDKIMDASFACGIRTVDGTPIVTVHHDDNGMEKWCFEAGIYEINFTLVNDLRPGLYKFGIGAHEIFINKNLFYLPDVIDLEILDFTKDGRVPIPYNAGIINGKSRWDLPIYKE